jgi:membrane-associated phospholipid phosphatase
MKQNISTTKEQKITTSKDDSPIKSGSIPSGLPFSESLSPADKIIIAYLGAIACLSGVFITHVEYWWIIIPGHAICAGAIFILSRLAGKTESRIAYLVRCWYPALLIPFAYKELTYLIPRIGPGDMDVQLAALDRTLFGVDPTIWLERITFPALTELLQIVYVCYYFFPLFLALVLWWTRKYDQFHFSMYVITIGFFISYIGYITVPAIGPRFILADQQNYPLSGILMFEQLRHTLDYLEGITRDCFPSGHTELTLLVLYCAWRMNKKLFRLYLIPATALIFSTVYLRYHYVVDVIAGAIIALAIAATSDLIYNKLARKRPRLIEKSTLD